MAEIYGSVVKVGTVGGNVNTTTYVNTQPDCEQDEIYFNVRSPEINFVGRSTELGILEDVMRILPNSSSSKPHIIVISGLGGIGKTQLVRRFIERNRATYKNVIWINAERPELISESFKILAKDYLNISTINPDGKAKNINSVIEQVFTKLCKRKTLLVYDNVDNIENISSLLTIETSGEKPNVMITSRIQEWGDRMTVIHLKKLLLDDAIRYLSKTLNDPTDSDDDKKLLAETLQYFPLALRQATAHINYQRKVELFKIADYVAKYDIQTQEILNSELFKKVACNTYDQTTFTTWKITIDAIERDIESGQLAVRILNIIAYFDPDNIHRDILTSYRLTRKQPFVRRWLWVVFGLCLTEPVRTRKHLRYEEEEMKTKIKSAVRLLVNYSMLDSQDDTQTLLSVHRLVQKVIQLNLQETNQEKSILQDALELISDIIQTEQEIFDVSPHAMSVFLSTLKFDELIEKFSILPSKIISSVWLKYNQAKAFCDKIQDPLTNILGENHEDMLLTKLYIGKLYRCQGLHTEALHIFLDVFEKRKSILGEDHRDTLITRSNIAFSYRKLGDHSKALLMYLDVFEKRKSILGEDHPDTLITRSNIAFSYRELGDHSKALLMFLDVFEKMKLILGEDHPHTLITRSNIAFSYRELGDHSKALLLHLDVFEKRKSILGEDHPETLTTRANIAYSYRELGDHSKALQMFLDVFEKRKSILGEDHPDTLTTRSNIAFSYTKLGNHTKALQMFLDVFEKRKLILGEDHPDTLITRSDVAFSYRELGNHSKALQMFLDVFEKRKSILGEDHPDTLTTRSCIAFSYRKLGNHTKALQMFLDVFEKRKLILGEDHPDTLITRSDVAFSYRELGNHSKALLMYLDVFEKMKLILGEDHPHTLITRSNIAFSYREQGDHSKTLQMFLDVYDKQANISGEDHPNALRTRSYIASSYIKLGEHSKALQIYLDVYDKQKNILGENHLDTLMTKSKVTDLNAIN